MKKMSARSIKASLKKIEALKDKFEKSWYYVNLRLSGGMITPLYDADLKQEGWWLIFDCPKAFSVDCEELQSMESCFANQGNLSKRIRYVKAWVHFDGSCSIWFGIHLE